MKTLFFSFFLTIFIVKAKEIADQIEGTEIRILNETNFDKFVKENSGNKLFLMFYSWWCPHCKKVLNNLQELRLNLTEENIKYAIIEW